MIRSKFNSFLADIKSGKPSVKSPIYSHLTYDIVPDKFDIVDQPDILILEGLNVLQTGSNKAKSNLVSDFVDFSIYVDADENLLKEWYIKRFLKFRQSAFTNPDSYFKHYANLSEQEAIETASNIWDNINGLNLKQNILPTRERANLILRKGENHEVELVKFKKIKRAVNLTALFLTALRHPSILNANHLIANRHSGLAMTHENNQFFCFHVQ